MVAGMRDNAGRAEEVTRLREASRPPAPDGVAPGVRKRANQADDAAAAAEATGAAAEARAEAAAAALDSDAAVDQFVDELEVDQHRGGGARKPPAGHSVPDDDGWGRGREAEAGSGVSADWGAPGFLLALETPSPPTQTLPVHVDHEGDLWHPVSPAADATLAQPGAAVQKWEEYV
jgi:hypothetical protein